MTLCQFHVLHIKCQAASLSPTTQFYTQRSRGGATIGSGWYIPPPLSKAGGYKGVQVGSTGGTDYCFLSRSYSMFEHSHTSHDHNRIHWILHAQLQPQYSLTEGFYCAMLMQSAVFTIVFCLSVCLSHACIVPELRSRSP